MGRLRYWKDESEDLPNQLLQYSRGKGFEEMIRYKTRNIILLLILLLRCNIGVIAQDTLRATLKDVSIIGNRTPSTTKVIPTQVVTDVVLERRGAMTVGDAVKEMAGLTLKDYGGVGGMKTVSIRGLGSQFSALTIDGVSINDAQNGQVDLSRYQLGGVSFVSVSQGQEENTLLPARSYAAGNVINMESLHPTFYGRKYNLKAKLEGGSFGLVSPAISWEQKINRRWSLSFYGNYLKSDGNYPFTLHYGNSRGDSTSIERRINSQVALGTIDFNIFGNLRKGSFVGKVHSILGYHALPGPVTYYTIKGSEHSEEVLHFVQGRYKRILNSHWKFQVVGKYKYSNDIYEDTASHLSATGLILNEYAQQEGYLSGTVNYSPSTSWILFFSNDAAHNLLKSNLAHFNHVNQWSDYSIIGFSHHPFNNHLNYLEGHLLSTWCEDKAKTIDLDEERNRIYKQISPYIGGQITPWIHRTIKIRYFYKETYRTPSFSENYYSTMTRDLKPEKAIQHNIGITCQLGKYDSVWSESHKHPQLIVDGYFNRVSNKIVAVPTQNMFLWSMMNLGKVDIIGCDVQIEKDFELGEFDFHANLNYSYQYAVDKTDPGSKTYNNQIPYTPRHSGSLIVGGQSKWVDVEFNASVVGCRYSMQQNTEYCKLRPYADLGISLSRGISLKYCNIDISARVLNLLNIQYEVVKSYPMMGRNYRFGIIIKI